MGLVHYKNQWGAVGSGIDQQRTDLFYVQIKFPPILADMAGTSLWDQEVAFALQEFPFPERTREVMGIKFLQQTNNVPGADTQTAATDMTVRYAFNKRTAELLERWHWAVANPRTGGVGLGSAIKSTGFFYWLIPNLAKLQDVTDVNEADAFVLGAQYALEGVWIRGLKPANSNMTETNQGVVLNVSLQIDRYYPLLPTNLNPVVFASALNRGISALTAGITNL